MSERPILFNGEMVRAILEGRKTQTRRPIKPQPYWDGVKDQDKSDPTAWLWKYNDEFEQPMSLNECLKLNNRYYMCPFGRVGDRLWVRETWARHDQAPNGVVYKNPPNFKPENDRPVDKWKPSIHMPRWASRITLEITNIRVERVQDISEEDAREEGFYNYEHLKAIASAKKVFPNEWDSIYKAKGYGWDKNPWVWVVEFRKEQGE